MAVARLLDTIIRVVLAPGAVTRLSESARRVIGASPPEVLLLDVGCGYLSPLRFAGFATIGVDIDARRAGAHAGLAVAADAAALPFPTERFAAVASLGLLHHLDDERARRAIGEMARVARPDGVVAIFDAVLPKPRWRRPVATLIRWLDFGGHMRDEARLRGLFSENGAWRFERITYALTGLEGLWCVRAAGARLDGEHRHD